MSLAISFSVIGRCAWTLSSLELESAGAIMTACRQEAGAVAARTGVRMPASQRSLHRIPTPTSLLLHTPIAVPGAIMCSCSSRTIHTQCAGLRLFAPATCCNAAYKQSSLRPHKNLQVPLHRTDAVPRCRCQVMILCCVQV